MADQDLTSLDEQRPDGAVDQILTLDDAERTTRRQLKAWADVEHSLVTGGHTIATGATAPATPTPGQLWFNTNTNELLIVHPTLNRWVPVEQPAYNYLYNSSFSRFLNATTNPIGWGYYGTSTTGTVGVSGPGLPFTNQKFGPYALAINSGNGSLYVYQHGVRTIGPTTLLGYWSGRTLSLGCWVWANVPNSCALLVNCAPSGTGAWSSAHPGDSTWRWLTATATMPTTPVQTEIAAQLATTLPGTTAFFSNPTLVEGSWCPRVVPSEMMVRSEIIHMGSANGVADTVQGGLTYYGPQGGHVLPWLAFAIIPFRCLMSNLRFYMPSSPGAGQSASCRLVVNGFESAITCAINDLNTLGFNNTDKVEVPAGATVGLKVFTTIGANISAIRACLLVEEVPYPIV